MRKEIVLKSTSCLLIFMILMNCVNTSLCEASGHNRFFEKLRKYHQKKNFFNDLPDELLLEIFAYSDLPGLSNIGKADSRFSGITSDPRLRTQILEDYLNSVYRFLELNEKDNPEILALFHEVYPHLEVPEGVSVSAYEIGESPVSQLFYTTVMGKNPSLRKKKSDCVESFTKIKVGKKRIPLCPEEAVENVTWDDVQLFLKRLNKKMELTGYRYDLANRAQLRWASLGRLFSVRNPMNERWDEFKEYDNGHSEWSKEDNGRSFVSATFPGRKDYPIPYASGILGLGYLLATGAWQAILSVGKPPIVPYYKITFRVVRFPIVAPEKENLLLP